MADITSIIENSIAEAADAGIVESDATPDAAETTETEVAEVPETPEVPGTEPPESEDSDEVPAAETVEKPVVEKKADEPKDDLEKELEALGLGKKELKPGERENRLPYSRTRKIVGNAIKRTTEKFQGQVTELTTKHDAVTKENQVYKNADRIIFEEPDRYIGMLAALHPDKYGKYVEQARKPAVEKVADAPVVDPKDPEPTPDHTFEDGSKGFTPEGFQKLREWDRRQATREANAANKKLLDERLGPIEAERQQAEQRAAQAPRIKAQVASATETWGKAFTDDYDKGEKSEILAAMRANDGRDGKPFMSFDACVAKVLTPKLRADRDTMRTEIHKELQAAPAKVVKAPAGTVKATPNANEGPRKMEDIIKEQIDAAGIR